jgi:hypothetical protein
MVGGACGFDQSRHFLLAQDQRESLGPFGINQIEVAIRPTKYLDEEESQRSDPSDDRFNSELAIVQKVQLILS